MHRAECGTVLLAEFEFGRERVMVAAFKRAFFHRERTDRSTVQDLVDMEPEQMLVVGDHRAEAGLRIRVLKSFPAQQTVGVTFGDIVKVTA